MKGATHTPPRLCSTSRISIRAPNEGSDRKQLDERLKADISIRAPNEGSDKLYGHITLTIEYFNPRSQ